MIPTPETIRKASGLLTRIEVLSDELAQMFFDAGKDPIGGGSSIILDGSGYGQPTDISIWQDNAMKRQDQNRAELISELARELCTQENANGQVLTVAQAYARAEQDYRNWIRDCEAWHAKAHMFDDNGTEAEMQHVWKEQEKERLGRTGSINIPKLLQASAAARKRVSGYSAERRAVLESEALASVKAEAGMKAMGFKPAKRRVRPPGSKNKPVYRGEARVGSVTDAERMQQNSIKRRRKMSDEGRSKIRAAQMKRWARWRKERKA